MYVYRNKTDLPLTIPQVGEVEPQGTITSSFKLENQNLEEVEAPKQEQEGGSE